MLVEPTAPALELPVSPHSAPHLRALTPAGGEFVPARRVTPAVSSAALLKIMALDPLVELERARAFFFQVHQCPYLPKPLPSQ